MHYNTVTLRVALQLEAVTGALHYSDPASSTTATGSFRGSGSQPHGSAKEYTGIGSLSKTLSKYQYVPMDVCFHALLKDANGK